MISAPGSTGWRHQTEGELDKRARVVLKTTRTERYGLQILRPSPYHINLRGLRAPLLRDAAVKAQLRLLCVVPMEV